MNKFYFIIIGLFSFICMQEIPYEEYFSKSNPMDFSKTHKINDIIKKSVSPICNITQSDELICQLRVDFVDKELHTIDLTIEGLLGGEKLFIIDDKDNFIGPYYLQNNIRLVTNPLYSSSLIIEINGKPTKKNILITINDTQIAYNNRTNHQYKAYTKKSARDNPIILLTGFWPPTNEMIRHFSQSNELNPSGWQGENWEDRGYDIISYFPEFDDPDCSSCGQGYGDLEVDYQDTSGDFWPIANDLNPLGIVTFSRGYMDQSWELEYNAYNRTNWYNDFTAPFLPTPNPPDSNEVNFFLRNSNLPMDDIITAIDNLNIGLAPYIDINGDPGHYVSEFMAYHGTWYRDLNLFGEENCIAAGHIHVGGYIDWDTAVIATEESIRVLIDYLDSFTYISGDLNQDEIIDILDLVIVINSILGSLELSNIQTYAADINEDSIINIQDVILMINIILNQ